MGALLCCSRYRGDADERARLVTWTKGGNETNNEQRKPGQPGVITGMTRERVQPGESLGPDLEDIIDQISSGEDDETVDSVQEAKYEAMLQRLED